MPENICDLQVITGMCWKGQGVKKERRSSGEANSSHDCTGICAWKIITFFFFHNLKVRISPSVQLLIFILPICLSYTQHTRTGKHAASGEKAYKWNMELFPFYQEILHSTSSMKQIRVKCLKFIAEPFRNFGSAAIFLNFKISKLRICSLSMWSH